MMSQTEETLNLERIAKILCADDIDYGLLQQILQGYRSLLTRLTDLDLEGENAKSDLSLTMGKAIGTTWAVHCIDDLLRTKRFVKGLYEAVKSLLRNGQKRPIEILYAGSGPFAALALPLTCLFGSHELRIHALEINALSCAYLEKLIEKLGLRAYFHSIENVDAANYLLPKGQQIDILLSETMQRGLEKEPQVAIIQHLLPQLGEEVILIPEKIELHLGVASYTAPSSLQPTYRYIAKVFELGKEAVKARRMHGASDGTIPFPSQQVRININELPPHHQFVLLTEISIFKNERLGPNESGITLPVQLPTLNTIEKKNFTLDITYEMGAHPGLRIREWAST